MLADDLVGAVALDALGAGVPALHHADRVERDDRVLLDVLDQLAEQRVALAQPRGGFRRTRLRHPDLRRLGHWPVLGSSLPGHDSMSCTAPWMRLCALRAEPANPAWALQYLQPARRRAAPRAAPPPPSAGRARSLAGSKACGRCARSSARRSAGAA